MDYVFVSYVHDNERAVARLCDAMISRGINVWLDRKDIAPGIDWRLAIQRAIAEGAFFIACFSREYKERVQTHMNEELRLAVEILRKLPQDHAWFIPIKLNECEIPDFPIGLGRTLRDIQYVPLCKDWDSGVHCIVNAIQPTKIHRLLNELANLSARIRINAAWELGEIGDPVAIPALAKALDDEESRVRINIISALGKIGHPSVIDVLIEALGYYQDRWVRETAVFALGEIGTAAIPALKQALRSDNKIARVYAAAALGEIGTAAIPALKQTLSNEDQDLLVRVNAISSLKQIGTQEALEAIEGRDNMYAEIYGALSLTRLMDYEDIK